MVFAKSAVVSALTLSLSILAQAQAPPSPDRLQALEQKMSNIPNEAFNKLSPALKNALSGGALNYLQIAQAWKNIEQSFGDGTDSETLAKLQAALASNSNPTPLAVSLGPIRVSSPSTDFLLSVMGGFTQSETSTAWCGSSVVTGFNDSTSELVSALFGAGGLTISSAAASADGGISFHDIGFINPGSNPYNFLSGDPVVNCTDTSTFYFSQIGSSGSFLAPTSVVFLSTSTDGGFSWGDPIAAVSKDANLHGLDKDWSTVDPKNPMNIYVTYTDFDITGEMPPFGGACPGSERVAIEIVHSTDGGATWSQPTVLDQVCSSIGQFVQGSQVVVDSKGQVFVEWEYFPAGIAYPSRQLRIARSANKGTTFQPFTSIGTATATGDGYALQGYFRSFLTGSLAVDRSGTKSDGNLYLAWEDGRFLSRTDFEAPYGYYRYANVLISRSADGGSTWSAPLKVNNDALQSSSGSGIDHYQPGVAVDANGRLAACWYDRRDGALNYLVSRYCGTSSDTGITWTNLRVDPSLWSPVHATDAFINLNYLGDYDTVTSDQLGLGSGFQGAYGNVSFGSYVPNQNVLLVHLLP